METTKILANVLLTGFIGAVIGFALFAWVASVVIPKDKQQQGAAIFIAIAGYAGFVLFGVIGLILGGNYRFFWH